MGKVIHLGLAGPDDPIYKEGVTMYAKPSFPQQESLPESKDGTPNSQQPPSKTQGKHTPQDDDPNRPETEEDGFRAEAIRRLKVHHLFKGRQDQTQE